MCFSRCLSRKECVARLLLIFTVIDVTAFLGGKILNWCTSEMSSLDKFIGRDVGSKDSFSQVPFDVSNFTSIEEFNISNFTKVFIAKINDNNSITTSTIIAATTTTTTTTTSTTTKPTNTLKCVKKLYRMYCN